MHWFEPPDDGVRVSGALSLGRHAGGGNRSTAFVMKSYVAVRGGCPYSGAASPDTRDFVNTPSILSGDLKGSAGA